MTATMRAARLRQHISERDDAGYAALASALREAEDVAHEHAARRAETCLGCYYGEPHECASSPDRR